jgi:hypothetical protein
LEVRVAAIATVTGTAIRPGISKNNRKYTTEAISRMVDRAQARLADGDMPLTTLTHHEAGDDSTRIVGRITRIAQEADGSVSYDAEITDTSHGRDILSLVAGPSPVLKGVSIRGAWLGPVRRESGPDGSTVETADDLELDGLDYTRKPGVPGAGIASVVLAGAEPRESDGTSRVPIAESAPEATVTITETAATEAGPHADLGYLGGPRLPIGTRTQAKASWLALCESATARQYTAAQLKRVKDRAGKALKGHGVARTEEGWLVDPAAPVTEALAECWDMVPDRADMYLSLTNGPTTITVSSRLLDPHDLDAVGRAAMAGACTALAAIDPDMDADIDLAGAPTEDTDGDMGETAPTDALPQTPAPETPVAETPTQEKEPAMAESTTPAAETPGSTDGINVLGAKIDKLSDALAGFVTAMTPAPAATESAPATEAVTEAAAPVVAEVTETDEQRIARLVAEGIATALPKAVQEHVETTGGPARKGLITPVTEHTSPVAAGGLPEGWPAKPLHEYTDEEFRQHVSPATVNAILGARASS